VSDLTGRLPYDFFYQSEAICAIQHCRCCPLASPNKFLCNSSWRLQGEGTSWAVCLGDSSFEISAMKLFGREDNIGRLRGTLCPFDQFIFCANMDILKWNGWVGGQLCTHND